MAGRATRGGLVGEGIRLPQECEVVAASIAIPGTGRNACGEWVRAQNETHG